MNQVTRMVVDNCNFTLGTGSKGGAIYTQVLGLAVICGKALASQMEAASRSWTFCFSEP